MNDSLGEKLDKVLAKMEEQEGKKKKFDLPWSIRLQKGKIKKGYAVVQIIKTTGKIDFKMLPIEDNIVKLGEGLYHEATPEHICYYKKYPMLIVPEWNVKPFSPRENFEKAKNDKSLTFSNKYIYTKMKQDLVTPKAQWNMGWILMILGVIIGGFWLLGEMGII